MFRLPPIPVIIVILLLIGCIVYVHAKPQRWGFFAHRLINKHAVYSLPPEMAAFYKQHINYLEQKATLPDQRRYVVAEEAPRHYIDLDVYGDSAAWKLPRYWQQASDSLTADTLQAYGIVPWHIQRMYYRLTDAFRRHDQPKVLKYSAEIGHYIADANVPLHTTENYNGQLTDQHGIHGFWESRLPELFAADFDYWVGKATYYDNTQEAAWEAVIQAHQCLDSVLLVEKRLQEQWPASHQYSFEERSGKTIKVYSREYSQAYHVTLDGMVEERLRASILMVSSFWLTAWVDAGQPDLTDWGLMALPEDTILHISYPDTLPQIPGHTEVNWPDKK